MSKIVEFRQRIIDEIREKLPELNHVDWYDGLFDEDDVKEWGEAAPSAYISLLRTGTHPHSTGEMLVDLNVVVAVVTQDHQFAREADEMNWELIEKIAILAKDNKFGDPNAGPGENVDFKRMRHPDLRREAVAIGIVEWTTNVTIGVNRSRLREEILGTDGNPITFPQILTGRSTLRGEAPTVVSFEDER
ncbi:hypothetical protein [Methylobacterium sp. WL120]|uniref:hypothetical protein n=1 Tax=Methylobacterium sp. WL120 TaxID=2603887 RepID=UPI0011CAB9B6|nr:hypothetical protein [Methylobacterium sp. WL120]TXM68197.1 hypothetical protein FV229_08510 [Methylobacterium sp. WL120]